jgi:hypothetical protein
MSWVITGSQKEPAGDPFFFSNVSLLLHGDGPNGSTLIRDSSSRMNTVTAVGNAQISTAQSKFGGASIALDGNGDYCTCPNNVNFDLSSNDFTIEFWVYFNSVAARQALITYTSGTANQNQIAFDVELFNASFRGFFVSADISTFTVTNDTVAIANTWYHIAFAKNNGNLCLYVDGIGGSVVSGNAAINNPAGRLLSIGSYFANVLPTNGYIDDLRITKGVARYTANFSPPTAPFPDI